MTEKGRLTAELDERYEKLNKLWKRAEARLKRFKIPTNVWVGYKRYPEDPERPDEYEIHHCLGYAKNRGEWRICHGMEYDSHPNDDMYCKPISESTLDIRLETFPHFSELEEKVMKVAEESLSKLDTAIADFEEVLAS